uniref:AlNc14C476G11864 protein n=1 Tax=Albugo laibachii Nc14 TaxID=890382 RepID=F0X0C6_9STRA|nr:AlNc14C476G11864 [Albugo laibachii Nc14]|eukprot:CCA27210.1 AlNc14C476G11864 [Albugo laibachii Nc14]
MVAISCVVLVSQSFRLESKWKLLRLHNDYKSRQLVYRSSTFEQTQYRIKYSFRL